MSFFQRVLPKFLEEGRLLWLRTPLYIVNGKKFFYSDEELDKAKPSGTIARAKGLAKLNTKQSSKCLFGSEKRMETLTWSTECEQLLRQLMGEEVFYRKEFVFNNIGFSEVQE